MVCSVIEDGFDPFTLPLFPCLPAGRRWGEGGVRENFKYFCLDSYTLKSENLSLTFANKQCHAELGLASRFLQRVRS
jgi:hypothetical protein